jgi:hypothetical protein
MSTVSVTERSRINPTWTSVVTLAEGLGKAPICRRFADRGSIR